MASAIRLPSGKWRVQAGKKIGDKLVRKSFTGEKKKDVEKAASRWQCFDEEQLKTEEILSMTFEDALEQYISNRANVLSPSTVRSYRIQQRNCFDYLNKMLLSDIDETAVQKQINISAKKYAAKSLRNQFGMITAVLKQNKYNINTDDIKLKPKEIKDGPIPDPDEMIRIISLLEGNYVELQILFALILGLRQSEIAALRWENLKGNKITVIGAIVPNEENVYVNKETNKSTASTRILTIPSYLMNKIEKIRPRNNKGYLFSTNPTNVRRAWRRFTDSHNMPRYRVHDLRHAYASLMLKLGVPDKYAMQRLGQSSPQMIKQVYQHLFDSENENIDTILEDYFKENL